MKECSGWSRKWVASIVFLFYLGMLVYLTLIHKNVYFYGNGINLHLFHTVFLMLESGNLYLITTNVMGNVALFVPLGFFLAILIKRLAHPLQILLIGCLTSFGIELLQHNWTNRVFDIDDILLNTIGALIGWGVSRISTRLLYVVRNGYL